MLSDRMPPTDILGRFQNVFVQISRFIANSVNIPILQLTGMLTSGLIFTMHYYEFDLLVQLHVAFTTGGLALLISEAIMLIANKQFCGPLTKNQNALIHGLLVTIGLFLTIAGSILVNYFKMKSELKHLTSIHGISGTTSSLIKTFFFTLVGLTSIILLLVALILGLISLISKYLILWKILKISDDFLKWFLLPHHILGSLGYGIGMGSLCLGLYDPDFEAATHWAVRFVLVVFAIIIAAWTMVCSFSELCCILGGLVQIYEDQNLTTSNHQDSIVENSGIEINRNFSNKSIKNEVFVEVPQSVTVSEDPSK